MGTWGGRRAGSGRKKKRLPASVVAHPSVPVVASAPASMPASAVPASTNQTAPLEEHAPDSLTPEERIIWLKLAPHAKANRTLVARSAMAFELLCRNIVLERDMRASPEHRGTSNHRGMIQRIDAELLNFDLAPVGKPMTAPQPEQKPEPTSALDKFRRGASA